MAFDFIGLQVISSYKSVRVAALAEQTMNNCVLVLEFSCLRCADKSFAVAGPKAWNSVATECSKR